MLQSETVNAHGEVADDDDCNMIKMNHCPMFDEMPVLFQKWWIKFEIYPITNGFHEAISKDGAAADLPTSPREFVLSLDEKKRKVQKKALFH